MKTYVLIWKDENWDSFNSVQSAEVYDEKVNFDNEELLKDYIKSETVSEYGYSRKVMFCYEINKEILV